MDGFSYEVKAIYDLRDKAASALEAAGSPACTDRLRCLSNLGTERGSVSRWITTIENAISNLQTKRAFHLKAQYKDIGSRHTNAVAAIDAATFACSELQDAIFELCDELMAWAAGAEEMGRKR